LVSASSSRSAFVLMRKSMCPIFDIDGTDFASKTTSPERNHFQPKRGKINKCVLYCLVHNSLVAGSKTVRSVKGLARSCRGGNQVAAPVSALTPPSGSASAVDGKASSTRNAPFLFADVQLTFQSGRFPYVLQSSHSPSFLSGVISKLTKAHLWILRVRIDRGRHRRSAYSQRGHRAG
jgi:hypothetical protein